jgi:hypothetical protein
MRKRNGFNYRQTVTTPVKQSKIKYSPYANNLGYDEVIREKQEEYAIWYGGESDAILQYYIEARPMHHGSNYEEFWNRKDYFWAVVGREDDVKCTHSGLPKAIIDTLVNILGKPEIGVSKEETVINAETNEKTLEVVEDIATTARLQKIIEDNNFYNIHGQEQCTYTMVIGDGAYFVNIDEDLSEYPIIEYIDGRNIEFERKANRIIAITARKYYSYNDKNYMLTDRRSTKWAEDAKTGKRKRIATVEYNLYELSNVGSDEVSKAVELDTIPDTTGLENLEYPDINVMLAVPCLYRYNKNTERGDSFFTGKLDLFDDLDQSKSQSSNTNRLSTPVDYIPEGLMEYTSEGKPIPPKRYDRRFVTMPADLNAVGQNLNQIHTSQPQLNFEQYTKEQLQLIGDILVGLMSPATLGIDVSLKDNADAQREKEKITLVTRDNLVDMQTQILKRLFNLVLKIHDYMTNPKGKPGDYEITVNYPEYANPTFENKLAYLAPVYVSGGMSAKRYVNDLWGDALSDEEKEEEVRILEQAKNAMQQMQDFNSGQDDMLF